MLFNVLIGGTLTSLTGQITRAGQTNRMALRSYDGSTSRPEATATVVTVPEQATVALLAVAAVAGDNGRNRSGRHSLSDCSLRQGKHAE